MRVAFGRLNEKITKECKGDHIMLETNQIYCGNCQDIMKNIDDNSIDLIVTSPPYFNAKNYIQYKSIEDYLKIMKEIFKEAHRVLKLSRMCIINISPVIVEREKRSMQSYRIPLPFYFVPM